MIAAVSGFALGGGCELAMACHVRIASEAAKFGQPEVKLGICPGYGGTQRLPRLVGVGRALQLLMTGEMIDAAEAYRIGLVNRVVPAADLLSAADAMLRQMLANGPLALSSCIEATVRGTEFHWKMASISRRITSRCLRARRTWRKALERSWKSGRRRSRVDDSRRDSPAARVVVTVTAPLPTAITDETSPPVTLETIALRDFRNLARVTLAVPREGMAIVGDNGHGKTNLLEAIYYLQLLRSVRGARDQDVVRFGAAGFHVAAEAVVGRRRVITAAFQRMGKRKKVTVDGVEPKRRVGRVRVPARGHVLSARCRAGRGGAERTASVSRRRARADVSSILAALQRYRAALVRRNAALRDAARRGETGGLARAAVWEPALAEHGALLWAARVAWVERVADDFARLCASIGERGVARMRYATSSSSAAAVRGGASTVDLAAHLARSLEAHRAVDLRRGLTHVGPHRDDLELTSMGAMRAFGSAGQQRTASIALRLLRPLHSVPRAVLRSSCSMIRSPSSMRPGRRGFSTCSRRAASRIKRFSPCPDPTIFREK